MLRIIALAAWLFVGYPALAQTPGIEVQNAWSRAAPAGGTGVVFMTIVDHGAPDRLIGVTSGAAERAELHETSMDGGVMRMRPVAAMPVDTGKPVTLTPGGVHIMLVRLHRGLNEGDRVSVTLIFEKAGRINVTAPVAKAGGSPPK